MDIFSTYLRVFAVGGSLCVIAQILMDKTTLTPARILVGYVVAGVVLTAIGIYEPLVEWAGAGATVPLTGFGYSLAKGIRQAIDESGALGIAYGAVKGAAAGLTAAMFFGLLFSVIFKAKMKRS
ncbi:MAG: stage V sporulation protein AE [Clostridiales bacterium]|nr:stage V sporulation protein AE [Clostridiales bacterium]